MSIFKDRLSRAIEIYQDMSLLIKICKDSEADVWNVYWDSFWELSNEFPFKVEWCDMDSSYERDIMDRYLAIEGFVENIQDSMEKVDD